MFWGDSCKEECATTETSVLAKTMNNLQNSFADESKANRLYLYFAKKAEEEGFAQIARLFRAASESEGIHASNHFKRMDGAKSTSENLTASLSGENSEYQKIYPEYLTTANQEGEESAAWSFEKAGKVEQVHVALFTKAIKAVESKKDLVTVDYYVCSVCGNTVENSAPDICPICGAPKKAFFKVS